jgi:hypothetical protein
MKYMRSNKALIYTNGTEPTALTTTEDNQTTKIASPAYKRREGLFSMASHWLDIMVNIGFRLLP